MLKIPSLQTSLFPNDARMQVLIWATASEAVNILELSYEYLSSHRDEIVERYGKNEYETYLKKSIWFSKSELTFADFLKYPDIRNNFYLFFIPNFIGDIYRTQPFYARFEKEQPKLARKLRDIYTSSDVFDKKKYGEMILLYKAYQIMLSYSEVKTNNDLFC